MTGYPYSGKGTRPIRLRGIIMRILIDVTRPHSSGIGRYSWDLLERLSASDQENSYYALTGPDQTARAKRLAKDFLIVENLPVSLSEIRDLSGRVDELADVFVATNFSTQLLLKIPTVRVVHDVIAATREKWQPTLQDLIVRHGSCRVTTMANELVPLAMGYCEKFDGPWRSAGLNVKEPIVGNIFQYLFAYYIHSAAAIITVSDAVKFNLFYYYPKLRQPMEVIHPAVPKYLDFDNIVCEPMVDREMRLLYVANIEPRKNHGLLFETIQSLRDQFGMKVKLTLVGRKHYDSHFDSFKRELNQACRTNDITFKSQLSHRALAGYYKTSDIFVFPSLAEGFGIPLLESMYLGLPIVALRTPTAEEVCRDAAIYVDEPIAVAFAQRIIELAESDSLRQKLIQRQEARVRFFDDGTVAQRFQMLLKRITPQGSH